MTAGNLWSKRAEAAKVARECKRLESTFKVFRMVARGADMPVPAADRVLWTVIFRRGGQMYEQTIDVTDEAENQDMFDGHKLGALASCLSVLKGDAKS